MKYEIERIDEKTFVARPEKEIEVFGANVLKEALTKMIDDNAAVNIILDMSRVNYIDSSGLGVLVSTMKKTKMVNGKIILSGLTAPIKQILEMTSLDKILTITEDIETAKNMI